jgi:hypothetical protein
VRLTSNCDDTPGRPDVLFYNGQPLEVAGGVCASEQRRRAFVDSITMVNVDHRGGAQMGDRGRKKDKDKNQRQQSEKREQKAQVRLDKAKPSVTASSTGAAVRSPAVSGRA